MFLPSFRRWCDDDDDDDEDDEAGRRCMFRNSWLHSLVLVTAFQGQRRRCFLISIIYLLAAAAALEALAAALNPCEASSAHANFSCSIRTSSRRRRFRFRFRFRFRRASVDEECSLQDVLCRESKKHRVGERVDFDTIIVGVHLVFFFTVLSR